ncbi:MAG: sugar phosphate isomerase/epimerase family protein [Emergencia sp.]
MTASIKDRIYIATFSQDAVPVSRENGIGLELNDLCISESLDGENLEDTLSRMEEEIAASGAGGRENVIVHGPFTEIIPASIDHRARELGMERLQEAWDAVRRLGLKRIVVHSGYVPLLYFKEWHHERSVEFWKAFMADKPQDFRLYIENVFEDEPVMLKELVEAIGDSRVQVCLDVGHANAVTSAEYDIFHWIRILGPYIGHFHLHNNDGSDDQHRPLTEGAMDMGAVLECIRENCRPDVTFTIESHTCEDSVRWLLGHLSEKE